MNLEDWLLRRYSYYEASIRILGEYPLWKTPSLGEIDFSKSMTQSAYKDIKTLNEEYPCVGDIIDFLCIVSTCKLLDEFERVVATSKNIVRNILKVGGITDEEKALEMTEPFNVFTQMMEKNGAESRNFLRLLFKNPRFILRKEIGFKSFQEIIREPGNQYDQFAMNMARLFLDRSLEQPD